MRYVFSYIQDWNNELIGTTQEELPGQWTTPEDKHVLRKMDIRILPLSAFIYLLCSLDRSNIGM